ncbi:probable 39S ribosomal protein L24 mitochondrial [Clonorchis sinensis]|uniref:Large ribosomal subunit protein uL24m n=1 Tax=Clonorchis sinensis TaxID=79923 RepID=G7YMN8_CLOSI|nr:probable 39S ribosomal protein L24 mitochondrial [Clonorchis sinensis]
MRRRSRSTVGRSECPDFRVEAFLRGKQQRCFRKYGHANRLGEVPYFLHAPITDDSTTLPSDHLVVRFLTVRGLVFHRHTDLLPIWAVALFVGPAYILNHHITHLPRYALDQDRLSLIVCCLEILLLGRFVSNLQIELLRVEFDHFSASQQSISPSELAQSVLRFTRQKPDSATKRLEAVANSTSLAGKRPRIYCGSATLYRGQFTNSFNRLALESNGLSVVRYLENAQDTLLGVINEYLPDLADHQLCSLSRQPLVHTIQNIAHIRCYIIKQSATSNEDRPGPCAPESFKPIQRSIGRRVTNIASYSSNHDFIDVIYYSYDLYYSSCVSSLTFLNELNPYPPISQFKDPALRFSYWPRYVARLLRFRAVYRKELLGWKFQTEQPFERPDKKPNEYREDAYLPVWRFSEAPPWNIANRISEFPYPDTDWCVVLPGGKKVRKTLKPMLPEEQLIFKGDRVKILVGPDKGKVGIVSSVLKMRRMVIVDGLNYRLSAVAADDIRREELPLCLDTEIALVDPVDGEPCQPSWRYDDKGNRVRVSLKTGRIIPLPMSARILDDLTDPKAAVRGSKDTPASVVTRVTFNPADDSSKISFEEDLSVQFGLDTTKKPFPTFWSGSRYRPGQRTQFVSDYGVSMTQQPKIRTYVSDCILQVYQTIEKPVKSSSSIIGANACVRDGIIRCYHCLTDGRKRSHSLWLSKAQCLRVRCSNVIATKFSIILGDRQTRVT